MGSSRELSGSVGAMACSAAGGQSDSYAHCEQESNPAVRLSHKFLFACVSWQVLSTAVCMTDYACFRQLAVGGSVADVEGQKKRLDTFAKALSTLDERTKVVRHVTVSLQTILKCPRNFQVLDRTANELIAGNHMEKSNIELSRKKVELLNTAGCRGSVIERVPTLN